MRADLELFSRAWQPHHASSLTIYRTSIHWHGVRQYKSNIFDGTNGITECPIPPGGSRTYTFLATQYGTSW